MDMKQRRERGGKLNHDYSRETGKEPDTEAIGETENQKMYENGFWLVRNMDDSNPG